MYMSKKSKRKKKKTSIKKIFVIIFTSFAGIIILGIITFFVCFFNRPAQKYIDAMDDQSYYGNKIEHQCWWFSKTHGGYDLSKPPCSDWHKKIDEDGKILDDPYYQKAYHKETGL